jgi:dihydroorotate dehydrogenase electron transfer subunit
VTPATSPEAPREPLRVDGEVRSVRRRGPYVALTLQAPAVAERCLPGQFVSVGVAAVATLLRRPFSIAAAEPAGGGVEVVFDVVGPGTAWLAERRPGEPLDLVGPLGRPFPAPPAGVGCVLVGGGYGAAPLLYLARALADGRRPVALVMGAASAARLLDPDAAERALPGGVVLTTEDGSRGRSGRVTDVLDALLDDTEAGVLYACGPMAMLAAVARRAHTRALRCHVAVEEAMACGVGVCMTCVVPVRGPEGVRNRRACVDGPVFDGADVAWDALGTALSAPPTGALRELRP